MVLPGNLDSFPMSSLWQADRWRSSKLHNYCWSEHIELRWRCGLERKFRLQRGAPVFLFGGHTHAITATMACRLCVFLLSWMRWANMRAILLQKRKQNKPKVFAWVFLTHGPMDQWIKMVCILEILAPQRSSAKVWQMLTEAAANH